VLNKRLVIELKEPTGDMTPRYMKLLDLLCERGLCDGRAGADVSTRKREGANKSQ
jgi:hypothetical protein